MFRRQTLNDNLGPRIILPSSPQLPETTPPIPQRLIMARLNIFEVEMDKDNFTGQVERGLGRGSYPRS